MFKPAFTHPLKDWPLSRLRSIEKSLKHKPTLFDFCLKVSGRAQVGLVSHHNEKFRLLAISSVFGNPRGDLVRLQRASSAAGRGYRRLPQRGNRSQGNDKGRQNKQRRNNTPPARRGSKI